ncbi:arylsulfatase [Phytoactinopolyspora alkaliphila]|uniref:Arylsulfatase n=1 Tax=Phytoactinopolyspora alkaliphila TaxID=1783498 RepID=A0A6N9YSI7_9ACTN|nr:arylsulfatase [Phytoactinopolyspora alkaliphila]NED97798.1 arylsulfatase [Phytoactinopolyspora alkaliphila]
MTRATSRPNIVIVVADDLGFSDLGCYGGEIRTPALDGLAADGVRFSQFYNTARCSPSRASLLTGLHPHQTGVGILTNDDRPVGYQGSLNDGCVTMAELLADRGYTTFLSGKWHLSSDVWNPNASWPTRRGFHGFYGTLTGCGSYYWPGTLMRGEQPAEHEPLGRDFYYTDAITTEATEFLRRHTRDSPHEPFFLYVAYTAPHWPLHAPEEDIERYSGAFDAGWDVLREQRMSRLVKAGLIPEQTPLSGRDPTQPPWADEPHQAWQLRRMQAYAAQVHRMDRGIGHVLDTLRATGAYDNTLLFFLSDNGASSEELPKGDIEQFRHRRDILRVTTRGGLPVRVGNSPAIRPGAEDTYASYGQAWANLSNTPFRYYKRWVHEGGISTPFIMHWPDGDLRRGSVVHQPFQLIDVLPTVLAATGAAYPRVFRGKPVPPLEGRSPLSAARGEPVAEATLYWEHTGNCAVRRGRWKLVRAYPASWELYDMTSDRAETRDLSADHPEEVADLAAAYDAWAARVGVVPWGETVALYHRQGLSEDDAAG